jgi:hypothetical protein
LTNQRYCFGLGIDAGHVLGKFPDSSACLEVIDKDEAAKLIHKFDEEGLMHSVWTGVTPYVSGLCNCDGDCEAYGSYIRDKRLPTFFRAEYICQVDMDQCSGCRECMRQCQFAAMFYSSSNLNAVSGVGYAELPARRTPSHSSPDLHHPRQPISG